MARASLWALWAALRALVAVGGFRLPRLPRLRGVGPVPRVQSAPDADRDKAADAKQRNLTLLTFVGTLRIQDEVATHYLGDNATLFSEYLRASCGPAPACAAARAEAYAVRAETYDVDDDAFRLRVGQLWAAGRLVVADRAAFRLVTSAKGASQLDAQLAGGVQRALSMWRDMGRDEAAARDFLARERPAVAAAVAALRVEGGEAGCAPLLKDLLVFFKERFPYYTDKCGQCGCDGAAFVGEIADVTAGAAAGVRRVEHAGGRVELRACGACGALTRFVRTNDVAAALADGRGRCGEYSTIFAAMLTALGFEARWVFDSTDHVWVEVKLDGVWVHADPCEAALGEPQLYAGWGKGGALVVAFARGAAEDVTNTYYAAQATDVAARRRAAHFDDDMLQKRLDAFARESLTADREAQTAALS
ncbi:hypothetical protein M885DRAFT_525613 [Pelagophyceae sp. CCMP2097]|nr:hypothetical protein M885DRAFT_525613 [Pelagophyceae sp. CCMP2097]